MENQYCPLTKNKCSGKDCMWYVIGLDNCSINIIAKAVDSQADAIEEIKNAD